MTTRVAVRGSCLLAIVALACTGVEAAARDVAPSLTPAAAINKAGRQRMLSQRLAKAYLMVGQGIQPERGRAILAESTDLFEKQLTELKGFVPNDEVRRALAALKQRWSEFKPLLAAPPSMAGARETYGANEAVQEAAHRLTLACERAAGRPVDRLVNIAGRQRMLSQRMAKYYLFRTWDVNAEAARMELDMARAEFSSGMRQLYAAPRREAQIEAELQRLDKDWIVYRTALTARKNAAALKRAAPDIVDLSERVLETTERLVALYEKQAVESGR